MSSHLFKKAIEKSWAVSGAGEIYLGLYGMGYGNSPTLFQALILNHTKMHPALIEMIAEPVDYFHSLTQAGLIKTTDVERLKNGNILKSKFFKTQEDFVFSDLSNCNKTAWILPNYKANKISRMLKEAGKYSDAGKTPYNKEFTSVFFYGLGSVNLFKRISRISNAGILQWWQHLFNMSSSGKQNEKHSPVKPSMSGNIQAVFIILAIGLAYACICAILELSGLIFKYSKIAFGCVSNAIYDRLGNQTNNVVYL